jgi:hypothetical protein
MRLSDDPFGAEPLWPKGDPYQANDAIPTLMFGKSLDRFTREFPMLVVLSRRWLNMFAYPLSGGFQAWSLLPTALAGSLIALEDRLAPALGWLFGFRMLVVIEKRRNDSRPTGSAR